MLIHPRVEPGTAPGVHDPPDKLELLPISNSPLIFALPDSLQSPDVQGPYVPTLAPVFGSSEVLAGARTQELLTELKTRYTDRLVIVDLPPALLADDLLTIAPLLDGVLVVVSEGRTLREDVTRMRELLGAVRILGTVLNISAESEKRTY